MRIVPFPAIALATNARIHLLASRKATGERRRGQLHAMTGQCGMIGSSRLAIPTASLSSFARGNPDIGDNVGTVHRPKRAACLRQSLLRVGVDLGHCLKKLHHKPSPHDDLSLTQVALRHQQCPVRHPMP